MRVRGQADGTEPGPRTSTGRFALGDSDSAASGRELALLAADGGPVDELAARLRPAGLSVLDGLRVVVLAVEAEGDDGGGGDGDRGEDGGGFGGGGGSSGDGAEDGRALDLLLALIEEPGMTLASAAPSAPSVHSAQAARSAPSAHSTSPASAAQLPDGRALAILADPPPRTEPAVAERLAARLALLAPALGAERVAVGVSDLVTAAAALPAAVREAGHALALAASRAVPRAVAGPDDLATHRALLAHVPEELRSVYVRRLLGPLRAHDERHHTTLELTLDVFLQCSGSWSRCAARLDIHVNTLRYRIGRIAELTGRDPTELDGQTDLFLALRAR